MNQGSGFGFEGFYRIRDRKGVAASYETRFYDGEDLDEIMNKARVDGLAGDPKVVFQEEVIFD